MKVLLLGSRGYLGQAFLSVYPDALTPSVDIADREAVKKILEEAKPDVVINCAGKTGRPNVDWCEDHKLETLRSNVTGPLILLEECLERGIHLVQLGSGCIYQGDNGGRGYTEEDPPNFSGSYYARTKAWIDQIFREVPAGENGRGGVLVLRLRMPFDGSLSERNLIMKLRKYPKVLDAQNSITHLPDFLKATAALIERRATGLWNIVNEGAMSPAEVMKLYREIVDPVHAFQPLALESLSSVVKAGRSNCLLSTEKLKKEGLALPSVREAVISALQKIAALEKRE